MALTAPIASQNVNSGGAIQPALTTSAFSMQVGDLFVIKFISEDVASAGAVTAPSASGGGITWTSRATITQTSHTRQQLWTGTVTVAGSFTVTAGQTAGSNWKSITVEQWRGAKLAASPAVVQTWTASAGSFSTTLTTVAAGSVVSWCGGDWNAASPTGRAYRSSATEDGMHDRSPANYTAYYAYQTAASAGSQTIGMTAPASQLWAVCGIEIQDNPPPSLTGANPGGIFVRGATGSFSAVRNETLTGTNPGCVSLHGSTGSFTTGISATLTGSSAGSVAVRGATGSFTSTRNESLTGGAPGSVSVHGSTGSFSGSGAATTYHLFDGSSPNTDVQDDIAAVSLGVDFQPNADRWITKVGFFNPSVNAFGRTMDSSARTGLVFSINSGGASGIELGRFTSGTTVAGWNWITLSTPIKVVPGTQYKAVCFHPNGQYAADSTYFRSGAYTTSAAGDTNVTVGGVQILGNLNAARGNGTYFYASGAGAFPDGTFNATNYWTDIEFTDVDPAGGGTNGALTGGASGSVSLHGATGTFSAVRNETLTGSAAGSISAHGATGTFTGIQNGQLTGAQAGSISLHGATGVFSGAGSLTGSATGSISVHGSTGAFSATRNETLAGAQPGSICIHGATGSFSTGVSATLVGANPGSLSVRGATGSFAGVQNATLTGTGAGSVSVHGATGVLTGVQNATLTGANPGTVLIRGATGSFSTFGSASLTGGPAGSLSVRGGTGAFVAVRNETLAGASPGSISVHGAIGSFTTGISGTLTGANPASINVRGATGAFSAVQNSALSGATPGSVSVRGGTGVFSATVNAIFVGNNPGSISIRGATGSLTGASFLIGNRAGMITVTGRQGAFSATGSGTLAGTGSASISVRGGQGGFSGTGADNADAQVTALVMPVPVYARVLDFVPTAKVLPRPVHAELLDDLVTAKTLPVPVVAYVGRP